MKARSWIAVAIVVGSFSLGGCRARYLGSYDTHFDGSIEAADARGLDASGGNVSPEGGDAHADGGTPAPDHGDTSADAGGGVEGDASSDGASVAEGDVSGDRGDPCSMAALPEPIAYYAFDDCADDRIVLRDSSQHMNDAEKRGRVSCAPGHRGLAILLDGEATTKGYVNVPHGPDFVFANQLTVSLWVTVLNAQYRPIISKWYFPDTFLLNADGDAFHFSFAVPDFTDPIVMWQSVSVTAPVKLHAWVHLAAVFDNGVVNLYRDGSNEFDGGTAVSSMTALQNTERPMQIGALTDEPTSGIPVAETFTGLVDEVKLYNQALTGCQVAALASQ
jgi:Concanavalin A-like lectin/glucanases superfamily